MATSSKLYHHLTSSFLLLNRRNLTRTNKVINFTNKTSPISSLLLKSRRSFCSAAAAAADDDAVSTAVAHPWPEWDQFVDKMRNKGYFAKTMEESSDAASSSSSYSAAAMDLNRVKNACLSFARERYDIIRFVLF